MAVTLEEAAIEQWVWLRDGDQCQYCGATDHLLVEHVIPAALGGPTEAHNLVIACRSCNTSKGRNIWAPRNLDSITADHPEWRARILAAVAAAGGNSIRRAHAQNVSTPSWGINARMDLRDAIKVLGVQHKRTLGSLIDEAMIDLLEKYGVPVPGEGTDD